MWALRICDFSGVTPVWEYDYLSDGSKVRFPRSTSEISDDMQSNAYYVKLYDGSEARVSPETKFLKGDIKFSFSPFSVTDELYNKLIGYIENETGIEITTHTGQVFEGYIEDIRKIYIQTGSVQLFNYELTFKQFDVDGNGSY